MPNLERDRLQEAQRREKHWRRWGPYLAERQWGTVREDYSQNDDVWGYFPHDHARSRTYRWGEDGLAGFSDNRQRICFAVALWNGRDPILKERLFGLSGPEGSHGEDPKEVYYYLDGTPTNSYLKFLYKYPQREFPYMDLVKSGKRPKSERESELIETGIFDDNRYFDVTVEYAKADAEDTLIRITVINRGPDRAPLHVIPTIWFRNTWSWGKKVKKPRLDHANGTTIRLWEPTLGSYLLQAPQAEQFLFTENETNTQRLYSKATGSGFYKDAFHRYLIQGETGAVNPEGFGTKAACVHPLELNGGETRVIELRLSHPENGRGDFSSIFQKRTEEADLFYDAFIPQSLSPDARSVERQAFAGLIWSRQHYHYVVDRWLRGDPAYPPPLRSRLKGRNHHWDHLFNDDIISMPDKWEYPWYAAWDTAFHMIPFSLIDPEFSKQQLALFLREWYMHPNGQIPAYEWNFSDVNPPVHAWACWRVYRIDEKIQGKPDIAFLESVFHKLLMNFTWWVNRKDTGGRNVFEGGFLGLDNIGVFDRSKPLPGGGYLEQSDGTAWMAMYCLNMLAMAIELALHNPVYEDIASKFFEHFLYIAAAMNGSDRDGLWDEDDGFYYDRIQFSDGNSVSVKIRSLVGLIPLFAVETIDIETLDRLPGFRRRMEWFIQNRPDLVGNMASITRPGSSDRRLLSLVGRERLQRLLAYMLNEGEFLSPHGVRSLSRHHADHPYTLQLDGQQYCVGYEPAESQSGLFGGNSNWRGPVWFPLNYLIVESLQKFGFYHGDELKVEFPSGSGNMMNLDQVAAELSRRLSRLFLKDHDGKRAIYNGYAKYQEDEHFRDHLMFFEYFHGDNGAGLGANHQTGWTALVAKLLQQSGE